MNIVYKQVLTPEDEKRYCVFLSKHFNLDPDFFSNEDDYAIRFMAMCEERVMGALGYYYVPVNEWDKFAQNIYDINDEYNEHYYKCDEHYVCVIRAPVLDWGAVEEEYREQGIFKKLLEINEQHAFKNGHKKIIAGTIIPEYFLKRNYKIIETGTLVENITTMVKDLMDPPGFEPSCFRT